MANKEHLKIIKQGVRAWDQWRRQNPNVQPDLRKADLRAESLVGVDLSNALLQDAQFVRAVLSKANLRGAKLNNAKLRWANLSMADLAGAELISAELGGADLNSAKLDKADLRKANLSKGTLYSASLNEADLSEADLTHADLRASKLEGARLAQANFDYANLSQCRLLRANLDGANLVAANLTRANLIEACLDNANLDKANLSEAKAQKVDFSSATITGVTFTKAIVDEDRFGRNQLSKIQREQLGLTNTIRIKKTEEIKKAQEEVEISQKIKEEEKNTEEKTDERQEKYGEGAYGQGPYGGDDETKREELVDAFNNFLQYQKGFPENVISRDRIIDVDMPRPDIALIDPESSKVLALVEFSTRSQSLDSLKKIAQEYFSAIPSPNNTRFYIVELEEINSSEQFKIFECFGYGEVKQVSMADFPSYEDLKSKVDTETEASGGKVDEGRLGHGKSPLSAFAEKLDDDGRNLFERIILRVKEDDLAFKVKVSSPRYINLKAFGRVAAQLHRWKQSTTSIALVLAGYQEEFPVLKRRPIIKPGNIVGLSGNLGGSQWERNWLKGKIGHDQLKYPAGVYVIEPEVLEQEGAWKELEDLLILAKKNAEGEKEPEEKKVSKYGRGGIATIQMDRLSDVDLLGRERLVRAFAGMFVHTEEVEGFTVALLGDWGEGKSTVMKLLRKSLNEKHPGRFDFATFNAWEYEHTDNIAAGLAQEVVKGLIEPLQQHFWERQILRFRFALKEYKGELWRLAIYSVVAIFITLVLCLFLPNNTLKGLGLAGGIAAVLFLLFKNLPTIIEHPIAIKLETYLKLPNYGKHLGDIPVIQSHLKTLCSIRLVDNKKLIVFVDDLDRCQTNCIAGALDAIRLVMSIPNVIVMIGIDYRIAFKAMENYYEKLGDKERDKSEIARDYLGKIIQLPVQFVPSSTEEVRKYIEKRLFPDAQIMEDIEKDTEIDTEGDVIKPSKPIKETIEAEREKVGVRIPDDKKVEEQKSVEEILKDTTIERDIFSNLAQRFNFTNPRQLLRLRNSYRFLKVMDSDEKYDREILMKILFWQEFLNNWPSIIRDQCEKSVTKEESFGKIEKHEAKHIVQGVKEDILKIIGMPMYEEIERFVRIVVLPHSEEGVLDTRGEIEELTKKREEGEAQGAAS